MRLEKELKARKTQIFLAYEVIQDFRFIIQCYGNEKDD